MKGKKLTALLLAFAMAAIVAGCGNGEDPTSGNTEAPGTTANKEAAAGDDSAVADETVVAGNGQYNVTWEDTAEIVIVHPSMGPVSAGLSAVEDAINKITEAAINVHVTLTQIEMGSYDQQASLMISSNEQTDLLVTLPGGPTSFATMTSQNQLTDMTGLMAEYAPTIQSEMGDYLKGTTINGSIYAVPMYANYVSQIFIAMRTDVLEDLGLLEKAQNMTTFTEYEEILEAVKNSEQWGHLGGVGSEISGLQNAYLNADAFADCTYFDNLGNTQFIVAVDPSGADTTVQMNVETEDYKKTYERFHKWYEAGYLYKDLGIAKESAAELIKSNATFSYLGQTEVGNEAKISESCGTDMTIVKIMDLPISTGSLTKFTWSIPVSTQEPEAAMTFLEMLFTDEALANTFVWGIEGVDYVLDENGVGQNIEGNEEPAYRINDFLTVNKFILIPWGEQPADWREQEAEIAASGKTTPYLGFSCDTTNVTSQMTTISSVVQEYKSQVGTGMADESAYNEYLEKLETAGVRDVVAEYQSQLDAWMQ